MARVYSTYLLETKCVVDAEGTVRFVPYQNRSVLQSLQTTGT